MRLLVRYSRDWNYPSSRPVFVKMLLSEAIISVTRVPRSTGDSDERLQRHRRGGIEAVDLCFFISFTPRNVYIYRVVEFCSKMRPTFLLCFDLIQPHRARRNNATGQGASVACRSRRRRLLRCSGKKWKRSWDESRCQLLYLDPWAPDTTSFTSSFLSCNAVHTSELFAVYLGASYTWMI